ncbi:MAG: ABC-type transport auxiliary lipoprotein family protein, partial [Nitrosospira sp.]|nr:ABC-type transport auxiliary lipoprotein family protein [Nitrosospira sp.]
MRKFLLPLVSLVAILLLAGCATPRNQKTVAIYDFGLQRLSDAPSTPGASSQPRLSTSLLVAVTSPAWLDSPAIQYRLAYHDLAQAYVYASNRWAAAPATLLAQRVKTRIAAINDDAVVSTGDGARADYALRLELEEFTQVFDTTDQSRAVVRLRASLIEHGTRSLVAQRSFSVEQAAPTANAAGAVRALTEASDKLIDN